MRRRSIAVGFVLLVGLVAGACGGSDDDDVAASDGADLAASDDAVSDTSADVSDEAEVTDEPDDESDDDGGGWADYVSPLSVALGVPSDPDEMNDFYNAQQAEREQFIAQCMAEQGFEYIPVDYSQFNGSVVEFDEEEYVAEYGFGISTTFLQGFEEGAIGEEFVDPNQDYLNSLSAAEQEAYYRALYGDQSIYEELDPNGEGIEITPEIMAQQGGCQNEASAEIEDPSNTFYTEFGDELNEMYERIQADPRIVEANAGWSTCMEDAGYAFTAMDEMYTEISDRMQPFYELAYPSDGAFSDEAFTDTTGAVPVGGFGPPELTEAQRAELEELQAYELDVAAANYECQQAVTEVQIEVQLEYEQAFVDENQAAIDALDAG